MSELTKKDLEHLAALARLDLDDKEAPTPEGGRSPDRSVGKEKLLKDLGNILAYFKELQELDTAGVEPMTGGTSLKNVLREDELASSVRRQVSGVENDTGKGPEQFPDKKGGYLRVPPVF